MAEPDDIYRRRVIAAEIAARKSRGVPADQLERDREELSRATQPAELPRPALTAVKAAPAFRGRGAESSFGDNPALTLAAQQRLAAQTSVNPPTKEATKPTEDSFYKKADSLPSAPDADILTDPEAFKNFITTAYQAIGGTGRTHNDAITSLDVTSAANQTSNPERAASIRAAYISPENQRLLNSLGGEQRVLDLQAQEQKERQQQTADYNAGRQIFGVDKASQMSPEELRTSLQNYYRAQDVTTVTTPGQSESQAGQARGSIVPAEPAGTPPGAPLGNAIAYAPNQPAGTPSVAELRQRLSEATNFLNSSQNQINKSNQQEQVVTPQPNQPPPPPPPEEKKQPEEYVY